jgi:four helix bundle suffix protein
LRQRGLRIWGKDSREALEVRKKYLSDKSDGSDASKADPYCMATASPEVAANTLICLINQASFLLGRQLRTLEQTFLSEGGFTERLYRERQARRRAEPFLERWKMPPWPGWSGLGYSVPTA